MKKILSLVLALMLLCALAVTAYAANIEVTVSSDTINAGDTLAVTITLEETIDVSEGATNMQAELHYDGDVLEFVSVEKSDQLSAAAKHKSENKVLFHYLSMDNSAVGFDAGVLVSVIFQAKEDIAADQVNTVLEFKNAYVVNAQGEYVSDLTGKSSVSVLVCKEHVWDDGTVTREPTCTEQGCTTYTCLNCGHSYTDAYADALGHNYVDGSCTRCGDSQVSYTVTFTSVSISLAGDIGVNYYVSLSDNILADEGAYMQFTVAGQTQIAPLSEAVVSTDTDGVTTCRFSCKVAAKQMTETIVGQMYLSDGTPVGAAREYSVKAYCDAAIPVYSQYASYANLVDLMEAMLNYGGYSQVQFNYRTENLANTGLADTSLPTLTADAVSAYAHGAEGEESGIRVASVSLLLESTTTIRFYFTVEEGHSVSDYAFCVDGVQTAPVQSGENQYYVDKVNVAAKDLDEMVTVTVGGLTVKYCGLSYVRQVAVLYPSYYSEALVNVAKALYAYNQAANAYFA